MVRVYPDSQRAANFRHPQQPWQGGGHQVLINTALEDLAGNKIGRAFDVDLDRFESVAQQITPAVVSLPFRIGGE